MDEQRCPLPPPLKVSRKSSHLRLQSGKASVMAKLETFSLSAVRQALGCSLGELGVRQGLALQNLLLPSVCYLDSLMQVLFKAQKKKTHKRW